MALPAGSVCDRMPLVSGCGETHHVPHTPRETSASRPVIPRRVIARGAAWSVPALTVGAAAPALAVSPVAGCPTGSARVDPFIETAGTLTTPEVYGTTALVVTIPADACTITYTIRGGDGAFYGGGGVLNTGTITRSDPSAGALTLTLIAGAHGTNGNPQYHDHNVVFGPGYGRGGSSVWLGYGQYGGGNGHAHSSAGGGGGGSAILLGTAIDTGQSATTPLVVAGGGGGGSATWIQVVPSNRLGAPPGDRRPLPASSTPGPVRAPRTPTLRRATSMDGCTSAHLLLPRHGPAMVLALRRRPRRRGGAPTGLPGVGAPMPPPAPVEPPTPPAVRGMARRRG